MVADCLWAEEGENEGYVSVSCCRGCLAGHGFVRSLGLDLPGHRPERVLLRAPPQHHRRQAAGAASMRTDERLPRLHPRLVPLIQTRKIDNKDGRQRTARPTNS